MNGRFIPLRRTMLACACLVLGVPGLVAQATLPVATALRSYDQGLREPVRLATDAAGRLYIADPRLGIVTVRDESGRLLAVQRGFDKPLGVAVDPSGRIFICEAGKGRVAIFTPGWIPAGSLGQGIGEFQMPNHIQITPDGLVYVVDSRANLVKVYGPNGLLVRQFGGYGALAGQFDFPTGLTVTPAGEIVVSDQGNERIQVFDLDGTFLRAFGKKNMIGTNSTFGRVQGLQSDAQGRLYLADSFRGVVTVMTSAGIPLGTIGTFGSGPGQLTGPASLVVDRNNRLFVATPGNTRVEVFGLDTYTDPHILFASLVVEPGTLERNRPIPRRQIPAWRARLRDSQRNRDDDVSPENRDDEDDAPPRRNLVSVLIKLPGVSPASILQGSITANGVSPAHVPGAFIGDFDGDGLFEFRAWFDEPRLVATMPDGEAFLVLSGRLADGRAFESIAEVRVINRTGGVQ
ncbi:MAG: NHL repeat-containing protein [Geothrix sp.]|nr:NHL repeat-containing protein [Geothrix sp.]